MKTESEKEFFNKARVIKTKALKTKNKSHDNGVNGLRMRTYEYNGEKRKTIEIPIEEISKILKG